MPAPISRAPAINRDQGSSSLQTIHSAKAEQPMAMTSDSRVSGRSYPMGIGRLNASMPTKCMAQMPMPMAVAPPANQ